MAMRRPLNPYVVIAANTDSADGVSLRHIDPVAGYGLKLTTGIGIGTPMPPAATAESAIEKSTLLAGGLAAILASTCCLGPLVPVARRAWVLA
jgi:hypothetical protein